MLFSYIKYQTSSCFTWISQFDNQLHVCIIRLFFASNIVISSLQNKCTQYWPEDNGMDVGPCKIKLLEVLVYE